MNVPSRPGEHVKDSMPLLTLMKKIMTMIHPNGSLIRCVRLDLPSRLAGKFLFCLSVFLEQKASSNSMSVSEIIDNYEALVEEWLRTNNLNKEDMINTFGKVRDEWIANDLNSWLDINTFYSGISNGITNCQGEAVLVTTKQQRFATALVRHAGIEELAMGNDDIYGLGMYKSKSDVIVDRMKRGEYEAHNTHFFEDRWPTIRKCLDDDRLDGVKFYLCSWGYCTEKELQLASEQPRVKVLRLEEFGRVVTS